ncbi:MAG: WXG100 family type VII secretion target [Chloroflexi bacterium]|nr:WXG100 family type VII secretion target [Chloroflexota bacterium]
MAADVVQSDYERLAQVAKQLQKLHDHQTQMEAMVRQTYQQLRSTWQGDAAVAFFAEMDDSIFPTLKRLQTALTTASTVTTQISQIFRQAEEEAAKGIKFDGGGSAGAAASAAGATGAGAETANASAAAGPTTPVGPDSYGDFKVGPPQRPNIHHDNGFLDKFKPTSPTVEDYLTLTEWRALLHGSKAATRLGIKDLDDANDAYEHFLDGNGADRRFNLDEYIAEDPSGKMALDNMTRDAMLAAENIGPGRDSFQMTSNRAYAVGVGDPNHPDYGRFPYPETENWQKAIGAHSAWTSSNVQVTINPDGTRHYRMEMTVHAEDRYNFNPGANDITTGIPDSANGRFEITGLAHQYMNYGDTTRVVEWNEGDPLPGMSTTDPDSRDLGDRRGINSPRPAPRGIRTEGDSQRPLNDMVREKVGR